MLNNTYFFYTAHSNLTWNNYLMNINTILFIMVQVILYCQCHLQGKPTPEKVTYPLSASQKVAMSRNIEKMIAQALNNTDEVRYFTDKINQI